LVSTSNTYTLYSPTRSTNSINFLIFIFLPPFSNDCFNLYFYSSIQCFSCQSVFYKKLSIFFNYIIYTEHDPSKVLYLQRSETCGIIGREQVSGLRSQVSGLRSQVSGLRSQVSGVNICSTTIAVYANPRRQQTVYCPFVLPSYICVACRLSPITRLRATNSPAASPMTCFKPVKI
jgi:hypothetical protein